MISEKELKDQLRAHDRYVGELLPKVTRHRNAYRTEFWRDLDDKIIGARRNADPIRLEINETKLWVDGFVSSLFYRSPQVQVKDTGIYEGEAPPPPPTGAAEAMARLGTLWLTKAAKAAAKQATHMGLISPECSLLLYERKTNDPLKAVGCEMLAPWECVWNRNARTLQDLRFIGYLRPQPKETVYVNWIQGNPALEEKYDEFEAEPSVDPLVTPVSAEDTSLPRTHQTILVFYDLTEMVKIDEETGEEVHGEKRVYLVGPRRVNGEREGQRDILLLEATPAEYSNADGTAAPPIVPLVLASTPERPAAGAIPVAHVYKMSEERNVVSSLLANATRRYMARKLLVEDGRIADGQAADNLCSDQDGDVVRFKAGTDLDKAIKFMDLPTLPPAAIQMLNELRQIRLDSSGQAEFQRGRASPYATATEIEALNAYTETNVGDLKATLDEAMSRVAQLYFRIMYQRNKPVTVRLDRQRSINLDRDTINYPWFIQVRDSATTPLQLSSRRQMFQEAQAMLASFYQLATAPEEGEGAVSPLLKRFAQMSIDEVVLRWELPEELSWSALSQDQDTDMKGEEDLEEVAEEPPGLGMDDMLGLVLETLGAVLMPTGGADAEVA